jgi:hypothetical protein
VFGLQLAFGHKRLELLVVERPNLLITDFAVPISGHFWGFDRTAQEPDRVRERAAMPIAINASSTFTLAGMAADFQKGRSAFTNPDRQRLAGRFAELNAAVPTVSPAYAANRTTHRIAGPGRALPKKNSRPS